MPAVIVSFLKYIGVGVAVGTASGLFGIGGGALMVPALIFLWHKEPNIAVATSLAVIIPGSIAGVLRHHFSYGAVDWRVAAGLMVGTVVGTMAFGAPLANYLPAETLKKAFGVFLVITGLRLIGAFEFISAQAGGLVRLING